MDEASIEQVIALKDDWQLARTPAGAISNPAELLSQVLPWQSACVPGTVAQVLLKDTEQQLDLDADDWWYRCHFSYVPAEKKSPVLQFAGLATIAQVWLNGELILQSRNMFMPHQIDVARYLEPANELVICFRALAQELGQKRPRPRWKTNLVNQQQLRWVRTTLLGHIPGWCPPITPVGPWRCIRLIHKADVELTESRIQQLVSDSGRFTARFEVRLAAGQRISRATLFVEDQSVPLQILQQGDMTTLNGEGIIDASQLWWPHTHGTPQLLSCRLELTVDEQQYIWPLGERGFRRQRLLSDPSQLALQVNDEIIFCRGACWTVADIYGLDGSRESLRRSLTLARDAGINMLRIGGTMIYESDNFYQLCDELGILVWQDFMFANMDYPIDDPDFLQQITAEVQVQLQRLARFTCISIYCGSSEVQQQAAMMGAPRDCWSNHFFDSDLPELCGRYHAGAIYFPSTPCGGALPFTINEGLTHYYGVGAYKRPLTDAALAPVKFTPEALGFSHVPEPATVDKIFKGGAFAAHHPAWKARVPRDASAGWDFEDIRDHYLAALFQQDPVTLRSHDPQRYLELSRVVTGEIIQRVFAVWRSAAHPCQGALLWFYKDLLPGAGWGMLDSDNQPKAVYYAFKRAAKPVGAYCVDRGLDGLYISVINETADELPVTLELSGYKSGYIETVKASRELVLASRSTTTVCADEMLGYFADLTYSYRFGPQQHDVIRVQLRTDGEQWLHEDFYFPGGYAVQTQKVEGITVEVITREDGEPALTIFTPHFLQSVRLELKSYEAEDNYFHMAPNSQRVIRLRPLAGASSAVKGYLEALNLPEPIRVR